MSVRSDAGKVRRSRSLLTAATIALISALAGCESSSLVTTGPSPDKCSVTLSAASTVDAAGGTTSFAVTALPECDWAATSSVDWISGLSPATGQGSATVQFRVSSNDGTAPREGDIVVQEQRLRVSQRAPCRFDLSPASQAVSTAGGAFSISVATNGDCTWTATTSADWISLANQNAGSGNGTVRFTVAANGGNERTGTIIVGGRQATVTQAGNAPVPPPAPSPRECSFAISPGSQDIGAAGGGAQVSVSASTGCTWSAGSGASWIAITSGASGSGDGAVSISVAGNTGGARTGTLTIAGRTAAITQAACTYTIAPTIQNVGGGGGSATPITVATISTCQWTASSNAGWISVAPGGTRAGNGSVGVNVAANTAGARTGTLTVAGWTSTVSQAAGCEYRLSPGDQTVGAGGGGGTIEVIAPSGCAWTSRSNAAWISVQSGLTGAGSGRVEYRVDQNGGASRTGSISIADQAFTVTQGSQ